MTAAFAFGTPATGSAYTPIGYLGLGPGPGLGAGPVRGQGMSGTCVVRLIDRRTGMTHRVNGTPLVIFTRHPSEAVAELLSGRDHSVWEARIDPIEP